MTPERNADDARSRSDEAVRRLREESAHRVARERRWRGFTSWCALASLVGGGSLAALDLYDAHPRSRVDSAAAANEAARRQRAHAEAVAADEAARRARTAAECAKRAAALDAIDTAAEQALRRAPTSKARVNIRQDALAHALVVIDSAADAGCTEPVALHNDL